MNICVSVDLTSCLLETSVDICVSIDLTSRVLERSVSINVSSSYLACLRDVK